MQFLARIIIYQFIDFILLNFVIYIMLVEKVITDMKQFYNMKYERSPEFYMKIELPNGPDKEYVCIGVKASNYFVPAEEMSKKPDEWPIPPIPKDSYPCEEVGIIARADIVTVGVIAFQGAPLQVHPMHWLRGAGMFATSLGPDDACFVTGAN